jgi:hypothetical protein
MLTMNIVSGGTIEFMRAWTERHGIPPEQVVGSSFNTKFEIKDGAPVLMRLPKVDFIDKAGRPVSIGKFIGWRPVLALGNSDGDQQMLKRTAGGAGARSMALVHVGRLDKAWTRQSGAAGWSST